MRFHEHAPMEHAPRLQPCLTLIHVIFIYEAVGA